MKLCEISTCFQFQTLMLIKVTSEIQSKLFLELFASHSCQLFFTDSSIHDQKIKCCTEEQGRGQ